MIINSTELSNNSTTIKLGISHNILSMTVVEARFDLFQTIESIKVILFIKIIKFFIF